MCWRSRRKSIQSTGDGPDDHGWKERIKEKQDKLRDRPDLTVGNLEAELQLVDGEIKRGQGVLGQIDNADWSGDGADQ